METQQINELMKIHEKTKASKEFQRIFSNVLLGLPMVGELK